MYQYQINVIEKWSQNLKLAQDLHISKSDTDKEFHLPHTTICQLKMCIYNQLLILIILQN